MDGLDVFHPDRMASRILGMGDVISLVGEIWRQQFDEEVRCKRFGRKRKSHKKNTYFWF